MKALILENGMLHVEAETALEAYALRKWCDENVSGCDVATANLIFDHSFQSVGASKFFKCGHASHQGSCVNVSLDEIAQRNYQRVRDHLDAMTFYPKVATNNREGEGNVE